MKKYLPFLFLGFVTVVFFYKFFFFRLLPFPGDLLISEYQPWKSFSFQGYNPGSYPSKKQYFDTIRQIYPWRTFVNQEIKQGHLPLWNPYNFSGQPILANLQSQVFYPFTLLYFILPQQIAWAILIILQPLLASVGMFLYLRSIQRTKLASLFGAISYGFCLYMTVFLEYNTIGHVIAFLPFILFSIEKIKESGSLWYSILFVIAVISSLFAGHLQIFGAILVIELLYTLFVIRSKKTFIHIVILTILSLGVTAVQLSPTYELLQYSARSNHDYTDLITRLLLQPKQLLTFINPDIYGNPATGNYILHDSYPGKALFFGSFPFLFSLITLFQQKKDKRTLFFSIISILILLGITNSPLTKVIYTFPIPLLSQSAPGNFLFLFAFSSSILAAYGLDAWLTNKASIKFPLIIVTSLIGIIWLSFLSHTLQFIKSMMLMGTVVYGGIIFTLAFSRMNKARKPLVIFVLTVTIGECWYSFQKFNPFVPKELVYPPTPVTRLLTDKTQIERFYGYGAASIEANFATQLFIMDPNGYDPLYPKTYGSFIYSGNNGEAPNNFDKSIRSDAKIIEGFGSQSFNSNPYRKKILDQLGIAYILNKTENGTTEETFPSGEYPIDTSIPEFTFHRNITAFPRVYLTSQTSEIHDEQTAIKTFHSKSFDPRTSVIIDKKLDTPLSSSSGTANITMYTPREVAIETKTASNQFLLLSDSYMPGWEGYIDNQKTTVYKANIAFRGVVVPSGTHTVTFKYNPESFQTGLKITILSIISLVIYSWWWKLSVSTRHYEK